MVQRRPGTLCPLVIFVKLLYPILKLMSRFLVVSITEFLTKSYRLFVCLVYFISALAKFDCFKVD